MADITDQLGGVITDQAGAAITDGISAGGAVTATPDPSTHAHASSAPTLAARATLIIQGATSAHISSSPSLAARATITAQSSTSAHSSSSPSLAARATITAQSQASAHSSSSPSLSARATIATASAAHDHASSTPALTAKATVAADPAAHAHTSSSPTPTASSGASSAAIVVQSVSHDHASISPALSALAVLAPFASVHLHTSSSPTLFAQSLEPEPDEPSIGLSASFAPMESAMVPPASLVVDASPTAASFTAAPRAPSYADRPGVFDPAIFDPAIFDTGFQAFAPDASLTKPTAVLTNDAAGIPTNTPDEPDAQVPDVVKAMVIATSRSAHLSSSPTLVFTAGGGAVVAIQPSVHAHLSSSPTLTAASGAPTFPATVDAAIPAPTATLTSGQTTYPATFEYGNLYDLVEGDILWRVQSDDEAGTVGVVYRHHVVTLADINATPPVPITFTGDPMPATGTYWFTHYIARGTARSGPSAAILHGPDNIAPILSAPTTGVIGDTTAVYGFTVNETGTVATVFSLANTAPSVTQIEAGQTAAGAAAPYAASLAITSAGAKTATATGLTAPNTYYRFHVARDEAGNRSAVLAGGAVTTVVAPVTSAWTETGAMYPDYPAVAGAADQVALSNSDRTVTLIADSADVAVKGTQIRSTGKYWVEYSVSAPAGGAAYPGLWDVAATTYINVRGDGASNNGPNWGSVFYADDRAAVIRLEVDMTATPKMIYAFVDGVAKGSNQLPSNMTNLTPRGTVGGVTGAQVTINTGQALPMGGATSGYTAWG